MRKPTTMSPNVNKLFNLVSGIKPPRTGISGADDAINRMANRHDQRGPHLTRSN